MRICLVGLWLCTVVLSLSFCSIGSTDDSTDRVAESKESLIAKRTCSSCHEYVPPDMLDRITWPRVLSVMQSEMAKQEIQVSMEDWVAIRNHYLNNSPPIFQSSAPAIVPEKQKLFKLKTVSATINKGISATLLEYVSEVNQIFIGSSDGYIGTVAAEEVSIICQLDNIPVDLLHSGEGLYMLQMGSLKPSNSPTGRVVSWNPLDCTSDMIVDSLIRPVHLSQGLAESDLHHFIISSFGSTIGKLPTGGVYIHILNSNETKSIEELPGATQAIYCDINHDGANELLALYSQGNERINSYSLSADSVSSTTLLSFPPVHGTNSFDISDIDGDGFLDIIVTNGDNDDYSQIYKPYHGVRIFKNDGSSQFTESYFYRINGASKVKSADFDMDGDVDFVVLAMYPDLFSRPWESVLYFENKGSENFQVYRFEDVSLANWILMDVADIDKDGDTDIIVAPNMSIGGLIPPETRNNWIRNGIIMGTYINQTIP